MTQEELRMRALELATRHALSRGPGTVLIDEVQKKADEIVAWVRKTPPTSEELRAYVDRKPEEMDGFFGELAERFNLSRIATSYVLACTISAVLESRKGCD